MLTRRGRSLCDWILLAALVALGGCKTTVVTSDGRPMPPDPVEAPPAPTGSAVNAMAILVARALDTNGNGFPDLIPIELHLLSKPHPTPFFELGAFVFNLYAPGTSGEHDEDIMIQWRVETEEVEKARFKNIFGDGYAIQLGLLEKGGDQYPLMNVNLRVVFEPADGRAAVTSSEAFPIQIGRRMTSGRE